MHSLMISFYRIIFLYFFFIYDIIAPPNSAFELLPTDLVTKLLDPVWQPQLEDVIRYHALTSEVRFHDLVDGMTATTANGEDITINLHPALINGYANLLVNDHLVDIEAANGVIHVIDEVLTPASISKNIVDIAVGNPDFSTLVAALTAADLVDALSGDGPLTVFGAYICL